MTERPAGWKSALDGAPRNSCKYPSQIFSKNKYLSIYTYSYNYCDFIYFDFYIEIMLGNNNVKISEKTWRRHWVNAWKICRTLILAIMCR